MRPIYRGVLPHGSPRGAVNDEPTIPYPDPAINPVFTVAAGRDPREIRRLLNISMDKATVDDLLPLVLRDGVSAFILASDDAQAIQAFGEGVAPALRAAAARERQATAHAPGRR